MHPFPFGKEKWNRQAVDKLLFNKKYAGRVLLQKTIIENGRPIRNEGQAGRYLYHNNNPVIISEKSFESVRAEKLSRSRMKASGPLYDVLWVLSPL